MDRLKKKYNKTVERLLERERMQERTARVYREKFRDKIHDKIVRFFAKIYRFAEKRSKKTEGRKISIKHGFKPFPRGLGLKPCFINLYKKVEVTRFELATPWSQTRCSTKLSHTSEIPLKMPYNHTI